jgi:hypothetical protein
VACGSGGNGDPAEAETLKEPLRNVHLHGKTKEISTWIYQAKVMATGKRFTKVG